MKKKLIQVILFLIVTLMIPYLLTRLIGRDSSTNLIPAINDVWIYSNQDSNQALSLEDYVEGVVLATIPVNYEMETLKAQAVIARTYALKNIMIFRQRNTSQAIIDSLHSQASGCYVDDLGLPYADSTSYLEYMGTREYETYINNVKQAVRETAGQVITYKGHLITPLFFSTSTGRTRNSKELWDVKIPYLLSVDSNQDIESPNYMKVLIHPTESVIQTLQDAYQKHLLNASDYDYQVYSSLPIESTRFFEQVQIVKRDSVGYVLTVSLGGILVNGDSFASALGLPSSCFYIENYEDSVRIICNGEGHGIGFSQYGANYLVKNNEYTYEQLITTYYTNVKLQKLS